MASLQAFQLKKEKLSSFGGCTLRFFIWAFVQWVYGMAPAADIAKDTAQRVHAFLRGARTALQDVPRSAAVKLARA